MSPRDRLLLALLVLARLGTDALRLLADPRRYWNFEEAYNATAAWALAHAGLGAEALALQYRSFCGGCTAVALAGAPLLALGDRLLLWKALALAITAATMVLGFLALDRLIGRAGAWAFAALLALPPTGAADLSLMLWGNHQETALFVALALFALSRERALALGLTLGLGVWFCRTALYPLAVLLPVGLLRLREGRGRLLCGLALGLAPLLLPAAEGDAGFYRMEAAFGQPLDAALARLATLLDPRALGERLFLPRADMAPAAALWLVAAGAAALLVLRWRRGGIFLALPLVYALLYAETRFPIFHVHPRVPLNNIRYHAPWASSLALLVAAGVGLLWARGWRRAALGLLALPLLADGVGMARALRWPADGRALEMRATHEPYFTTVLAERLPVRTLADPEVKDERARAMRQRAAGMALGAEVRAGRRSLAAAAGEAAAISTAALTGLGVSAVEPCADPAPIQALLATLPPTQAAPLGHGAAVALGTCAERRSLEATLAGLRGEGECWLCEAAGRALLDRCEAGRAEDLSRLGRCLYTLAAPLPEREALIRGAGLFFQRPTRPAAELRAVEAGLGEDAPAFREGASDPLAGGLSAGG